MSANQAKTTTNQNPLVQKVGLHIFSILVLLIAAMIYFRPVAFEGKSLKQDDNFQSVALQTELKQYMEKDGTRIKWTNSVYGGIPLVYMINYSNNMVNKIWNIILLQQSYGNPWVSTFAIFLFGYIALLLIGLDVIWALTLSLVLGFMTANTLYILAGHSGKIYVLSTIPLLISSFIYTYRKNKWLGASIFSLILSLGIAKNHVQMLYYAAMALTIIGIAFMVEAIKKKEYVPFLQRTGLLAIAAMMAIASNTGFLLPLYEYSQESTRGESSLSQKKDQKGLAKDYVFAFSYEKGETFSLFYPNFYGATMTKSFLNDPESATSKAFRSPALQNNIVNAAKQAGAKDNAAINQYMQQFAGQFTRQYRGSQSMCGGPIYYGLLVLLLVAIGFFCIRDPLKWGFVGAFLLFVVLAWGSNFAFFNDMMYDHFPMYSKFRDTKMTLLVGQPLIILFAGLSLRTLLHLDPSTLRGSFAEKLLPKIKQTANAKGIVILSGGAVILMTALVYLYGFMGNPAGANDAAMAGIPSLLSAIQEDRASLIQSDSLRALAILAILTAIFAWGMQKKSNLKIAALGVAAVACIDLLMVNADYVSESNFDETSFYERAKQFPPNASDQKILNDRSYYKVVDYSRGKPSQSAYASFFHKSMGGYSAAKPKLYEELWYGYEMDIPNIALKQHINIFNMLNVKYIIIDNQGRIYDNPTALGNVWFVDSLRVVANADEELQGIAGLQPQLTMLVEKSVADGIQTIENKRNPTDNIYLKRYHPDTMTYQANVTNERYAVFSEMYYPPEKGWNLYINGERSDMSYFKANYLLRGMIIPKGVNEIKFVFEPSTIKTGRTIDLISSILIYLCLFAAIGFAYKKHVDS